MPNAPTRMILKNTNALCLATVLTALALSLTGCDQGLGGGAYARSTVTILPDADAVQDDVGGEAASVEVAGYGTLKGRVVLDAPVTIPGPITPSKDAVCIAKAPIPSDRISVGTNQGLANVFLYLPKAPGGTKQPESLEPVTFDQEACRFLPHCLASQTGQTILILNSDATLHNTHTFPQRQSGFNQGVQPNEKNGVPLVYTRSEKVPVSVTCDIHPWMQAYHMPMDHPYNTVTGEDGSFEMTNLPAGKHQFTVWHEVPGVIDSRYEVEITVDGTTEVEIKVPAQSLAQFAGPRSRRVVLSMIP